jgi:hypothetical protein
MLNLKHADLPQLLLFFTIKKSMIIANKNLKKVSENTGIYGTQNFPAIKAPDQKTAHIIMPK